MNIEHHAAIAAAVFVLWLALWLWRKLKKRRRNPFADGSPLPYLRRRLMTASEMAAYARLLDALPDYMVFPQIQASRILDIPRNRETYYWFNFVSRLSYDFVICRPDGTPVAAIEIDDPSHALPERQEADHRKDRATAAAGIAMIRWPSDKLPETREIAKQIKKADKQAV